MSQPTTPNVRLIAGAMSGTSADGVDVAITRITGRGLQMRAELVRHHHRPYPADLRELIFATRHRGEVKLAELARMGREISLAYALAVNEALSGANMKASDLAAVAAHGQTLFHGPPNTIQWFDPALVAYEVGCAVVSDFRRADLAAGGQGAPLVPFADYVLFRDPTETRILLNIGGISNITYLPAGAAPEQVLAFDTGPGNCISDHLMRRHDPSGPGYDAGGALAMQGRPYPRILLDFSEGEYVRKPAPKSTDGPEMIALYERCAAHVPSRQLADELATAARIVADCIVRAIVQSCLEYPTQVIASGGGTENAAIMTALRERLAEIKALKTWEGKTDGSSLKPPALMTTADIGVKSDAKEALAFALLAAATLDGEPSNVPSVTGARRAVVLGSVTPKP